VIIDQFMALRHNQEFAQDFGVRNMTTYNDREVASRCTCSPTCTAATYRDFHQDLEDDKQEALDWFSKNKHTLQPPDDLTRPHDEDKILLPQHVFGFVLRSRKWGKQCSYIMKKDSVANARIAKLKLDVIKPIEYKNTFDRLVLYVPRPIQRRYPNLLT
jgi:hypothetical protein